MIKKFPPEDWQQRVGISLLFPATCLNSTPAACQTWSFCSNFPWASAYFLGPHWETPSESLTSPPPIFWLSIFNLLYKDPQLYGLAWALQTIYTTGDKDQCPHCCLLQPPSCSLSSLLAPISQLSTASLSGFANNPDCDNLWQFRGLLDNLIIHLRCMDPA